jgi:hypothetical protein
VWQILMWGNCEKKFRYQTERQNTSKSNFPILIQHTNNSGSTTNTCEYKNIYKSYRSFLSEQVRKERKLLAEIEHIDHHHDDHLQCISALHLKNITLRLSKRQLMRNSSLWLVVGGSLRDKLPDPVFNVHFFLTVTNWRSTYSQNVLPTRCIVCNVFLLFCEC